MHDAWGITDGYFDIDGVWHETTERARERLRTSMGEPLVGPVLWFLNVGDSPNLWNPCALRLEDGTELGEVHGIPPDLPIGYHELVPIDGGPTTRLIVHPRACRALPRAWGVAAELYALWSDQSWGIGDLRDLQTLAERLHRVGGRAILVSPLHQSAPAAPHEDSPYYPSSRRAWDAMLLGLEAPRPPELVCAADRMIERDEVWARKRRALEERFAVSTDLPPLPGSVAIWNALCDEFGPFWREWPIALSRHDTDHIAARLRDDRAFAQRAAFHQWCQSEIADQLADVTTAGVDIIGDLAIGFNPNGADAWEYQDLLALDMRMGAPSDPFNAAGQDWGIPPFIPWRLRNACYEPYIATIRSTLRGVNGLRIDHVMGLFRQFWMPAGMPPSEGAYVTFPADELLAILLLEAERAEAFVVGEDLGTVEPRVREALATRNIAGTRVWWFEDIPPSEWDGNSLATITTHDLPTIAGVWNDVEVDGEKKEKLQALGAINSAEEAIAAVHGPLLESPARLRLLALDDLCRADERPNHPGRVDLASWRRRLPLPVDEIPIPERDEPG